MAAGFFESAPAWAADYGVVNLNFPILSILLLLLASCASHTKMADGEAKLQPAPVRAESGYKVWTNAVYSPPGWPQALRADVYQPKKAGSWPGVLLIHGGGWAENDRRDDMVSIAQRLVKRGYVVMNATYRLAPDYHYPAPFEDLQEALKWFVAHRKAFDLDAENIAVCGYSAGGHLAALLGAKPLDKGVVRPKAVIAGGAPLDLTRFPGPGLIANFIGGEMVAEKEGFIDASPITHVSADDPPVFMYHGAWDLLVPLSQATAYQRALTQADVPNELYIQHARGHVTAFLYDRGAIRNAIKFLDKELR